jgi:hypothetical protein
METPAETMPLLQEAEYMERIRGISEILQKQQKDSLVKGLFLKHLSKTQANNVQEFFPMNLPGFPDLSKFCINLTQYSTCSVITGLVTKNESGFE